MTLSHEDRELFKRIAERVASELISDMKAGRLKKVGIDEIRARLHEEPGWMGRDQFDALEELTTRRLVEKVG